MTLAAKSLLRVGRPVVIAVSTNDGLGASGENIARLYQRKHYYFVPYGQDDPQAKPQSLKARFALLPAALDAALEGRQLQPVLCPRRRARNVFSAREKCGILNKIILNYGVYQMKKQIAVLCTVLLWVCAVFAPMARAAGPALSATEAYCIIDADTGLVLAQQNMDEELHPASITKVMTLGLACEKPRASGTV